SSPATPALTTWSAPSRRRWSPGSTGQRAPARARTPSCGSTPTGSTSSILPTAAASRGEAHRLRTGVRYTALAVGVEAGPSNAGHRTVEDAATADAATATEERA